MTNPVLAADRAKVEHLRQDIKDARRNFDNWISSKERLIKDSKENHGSAMVQAQAQRVELMGILEDLKDTKKLSDQVAKERATELAELAKNLDALKDQHDMAQQIVNDLRTSLKSVDEEKKRGRSILEGHAKKITERKKELMKGVAFYKERLGLQFSQINNEKLQFIFTNIDHEDWDREFVFHVLVDSEGKYQVPFCDPPVRDLKELVDALNETNSLSGFVKTIRKRFKQHCMI